MFVKKKNYFTRVESGRGIFKILEKNNILIENVWQIIDKIVMPGTNAPIDLEYFPSQMCYGRT